MADTRLDGMRVAVRVADDFEQVEMTEPRAALDGAGARTTLVSPSPREVRGMKHDEQQPKAQELVQRMQAANKPRAVICHAPWLLVSAGLVKERALTSYHTIQDDIRNADGRWQDREVVRDDNWGHQPSAD